MGFFSRALDPIIVRTIYFHSKDLPSSQTEITPRTGSIVIIYTLMLMKRIGEFHNRIRMS